MGGKSNIKARRKSPKSPAPSLTPAQIAEGGRYYPLVSGDGWYYMSRKTLEDKAAASRANTGLTGIGRAIEVVVPPIAAGIITGGMGVGAATSGAAGGGTTGAIAGGAAQGALQGGLTSTGLGRDFEDGALAGAIGGGIGGAGNWSQGLTGTTYGDAALRGAGNQAIGTAARGGDSEEILDAAQSGLLSGSIGSVSRDVSSEYGKAAGGLLGGAATGALNGGSQGAEYGAIGGLLTGAGSQLGSELGGSVGGRIGSQVGGLVAKDYIQGQVQEDRQAQMQQLAAQRRQQMLADPRYQKYMQYLKMKADPRYAQYQQYLKQKQGGGMMTGRPAGNSALSRLTPQQLQQMYAQYKARRA